MSYHEMSREEWLAFLQDPVRPGLLATTRKDGRPHVAPIWYALDGETLVFNTGADTVKGRNIRRDGRASICVQDDRPPFSFVTVSGVAEWSDQIDEVRRWAGVIGGRYMGADRADEYGDRNGVPGELLVRLRPAHVVAAREIAD
jgi:PPOX class probable F420-dependent enzyme